MSDIEAIIRNNPTTEEKSYFNRLPKNIRLEYFTKYKFKGLKETPECMLFRVAVLLLDIVIDDALMTEIVDEFIKCMANEESFISTFRSYPGVFSVHSPGRKNEEIARLIRFCDLMNIHLREQKEKYKTQIQVFVSLCFTHYKEYILEDKAQILSKTLIDLQYKENATHASADSSSSHIRDRSRTPSPPPSPPPHSIKQSIQKERLSVVRNPNRKIPCKYDTSCRKRINGPHPNKQHNIRYSHTDDNDYNYDNHHSRRRWGGRKQRTIKMKHTRRRRQISKRTTKRNRY
jgi:hypothetical protein